MSDSDMLRRQVERVKSASYLEIVGTGGGWCFLRIDSADGCPFHALPEEDRGLMLDEHVHWEEYERRGIDTFAARSEAIHNPYPEGYDPSTFDGRARPMGREAAGQPDEVEEDGYRIATGALKAVGGVT